MGLSYGSTTYLFHLTTRDQIPSGNEWTMEAENFEWHGSLDILVSLSVCP